jgi:hypothetical protein
MENKVLNYWILGVHKITPQTHMNSVQNPVSSLYPGWLIEIPLDCAVIFINKLGGMVPELIINHYFCQLLSPLFSK